MEQLIQVEIMFEGETRSIFVSHDDANLIFNDPVEGPKLIDQYINEQMGTNTAQQRKSSNDIIWTKSKPTNEDNEATEAFLNLRIKKKNLFLDKKKSHLSIYNEIAQELSQKYKLGPDGGKKCLNKFSNLQRTYVNHLKHMKQTGTDFKKPPPFYEMLHDILGSKDKFAPRSLIDSDGVQESTRRPRPAETESVDVDTNKEVGFSGNGSSDGVQESTRRPRPPELESVDVDMEVPSEFDANENDPPVSTTLTKKKVQNRFAQRRCVKPSTKVDLFLKTFKEQCEKDRIDEDKRHQERLLQKDREMEQRDAFLNLFSKMVQSNSAKATKTKKRPRQSSTSSED